MNHSQKSNQSENIQIQKDQTKVKRNFSLPFHFKQYQTSTFSSFNQSYSKMIMPKQHSLYAKGQSKKSTCMSLHKKTQVLPGNETVNFVKISRTGIRNFQSMENQDTLLVDDCLGGKGKMFCIFDGHGQHGKLVSEAAANFFKRKLKTLSEEVGLFDTKQQIQNLVRKTLLKTSQYLLTVKSNQTLYSGTTVLVAIKIMKQIFFFNIGNSRAIIIKQYPQTSKLGYFQITSDQTLNRFDQRCRIIKNGGIIKPLKNQLGRQIGPQRVWVQKKKYPGIYITRTMGLKCGHNVGIISQAEVSIINIKQEFKLMVLASDGLWDVINNQQLIDNLAPYLNKKQLTLGVTRLLKIATQKWLSNKDLMDDISIIAMEFK